MRASESEPASGPAPTPGRKRAPPPPPPRPTTIPEPTMVLEPTSEPTPVVVSEQKQQPEVEPPHAAIGQPHTKRKHRGLMRAIGGFFKRNCSDADIAARPNNSESSQRRTSRFSHSHRQSLPEAPFEVAAKVVPDIAHSRGNEAVMTSPHIEEPPVKKVQNEKPKKAKKAKFLASQTEPSPTDPSDMLTATLVDELSVELQRVSFLFFGGSDADSTFEPEMRPSELDDLHETDIRPSLKAKMPLFLSSHLPKNLRRSSIVADPKEYEF